jgi:hypothetical protein
MPALDHEIGIRRTLTTSDRANSIDYMLTAIEVEQA